MAIVTETYVGQKNDTTATTHVFSGVTIAAGKLAIIRLIVSDGVTVNNPTDSAGNTWAVCPPVHDAGSNQQVVICYSVLTNALSSGTVTINLSATSTCGAELAWFDSDTGWLAQASVLDQTKGAIGSTAAWSTGAASTTTQADELLVGACGMINFNGSTSTPDAPWIEETDQVSYTNVGGSGMTTVWQKVTTTGTYTASGVRVAAEFWQAAMATFKTAAGVTVPATAHHNLVSSSAKGFMFNGLSREDFSDVARDSSLFNGSITPRKRFIAAQAGGFYFASVPFVPAATPVSDTDTGSGADTATLVAAIPATDVNGTTTETGTLVAAIPAADVNGVTTETQLVTVPVAATDTNGTTTETATLVAAIPSTDVNGTTTETATLVATAITSADTGSGVNNTGTLVAAIPASDVNGTTTETQTVTVPVSASDANGTTTETATLVAAIPSSDVNGTTTETGTLVAKITATDVNGTTTEIAAIALASADVGVGTENQTVSVPVSASDTNGVTTEAATLVAAIPASDTNGVTTESGTLTAATFLVADTGTGVDATTLAAQLSSSDTGTGTESQTAAVPIITGDTGTGTNNTGTLTALISFADSASASESAAAGALSTSQDTGAGIDVGVPKAVLLVTESSTGVNAQSLTVVISVPDTGTGINNNGTVVFATQVSVADTATVADVAVVFIHPPAPAFPAIGGLVLGIKAKGDVVMVKPEGGYTRVR